MGLQHISSQVSFIIHFGSTHLVIFDGMMCIVSVTGRIIVRE